MSDFGSKSTFGEKGLKDLKDGTVSDIKAAPDRGMKRIIAREKTGMRRSFAVDIPIKAAREIERKETYRFEVEEKTEDRYGGSTRPKESGFKTYYCDETPEKYDGAGGSQFKSFDGSGRLNSARTKF